MHITTVGVYDAPDWPLVHRPIRSADRASVDCIYKSVCPCSVHLFSPSTPDRADRDHCRVVAFVSVYATGLPEVQRLHLFAIQSLHLYRFIDRQE